MEAKMTPDLAKEALLKLFGDAGYDVPGLLAYIEETAKENARLRREIRKWRPGGGKEGGMNSRLYDALRE